MIFEAEKKRIKSVQETVEFVQLEAWYSSLIDTNFLLKGQAKGRSQLAQIRIKYHHFLLIPFHS